jgi:hypothetical protein
MPPWEAIQIGLGLMVVPLILIHVIGTRAIGFSVGFEPSYAYAVASIWVSDPLRGVQQAFALVVVWGHACVGIHFGFATGPGIRDSFRSFIRWRSSSRSSRSWVSHAWA